MLHRPHVGETEEDLLRQEEMVARGEIKPSVTLVKPDKRKTRDSTSHNTEAKGEAHQRSRFSRERAAKKKKEGIVDNTILKEAVKGEGGGSVLWRVVERSVSSDPACYHWQPSPSPHGFPQPIKINILSESSSSATGQKKKSLYMQQLEKQGFTKNMETTDSPGELAASAVVPPSSHISQDPRLAALGDSSYVIRGEGVLRNAGEAQQIHSENIKKLANMSHEERLREQQDLLTSLTPEQLTLFKALRRTKSVTSQERNESKNLISQESKNILHLQSQQGHNNMQDQPQKASEYRESSAQFSQESKMECEDSRMSLDPVKEASSSSVMATKDEPGHKGGQAGGSADGETGMDVNEDLESEIPISELPIPPAEAKQWINMGKVEYEKLQWMTDMPEPRPLKHNEGFVVRFNFEGDILPYDADVSYRSALHHHGEEPGRAGYTLDEIFGLVRSQVLQQRHIGLRTLANILRNAKEGLYDTCVNPPVVQLVVEAGAVLLLRFALDDPSHLIYNEATRAFLHLTSSDPDDRCLELARPWVPAGLETAVASQIHASDKTRQELDKEESELKDHEVVKLDVIRALIRTDTHLRLRYLLETTKPGPETVTHILGLLTRIARHSLVASWILARTPRLLSVIIQHFLPHNLSPLLSGGNVATMTTIYGVPLRHALVLLRVMAAKGRELAALLVNTHEVMSRILTYVSLEPSEISLPLQEALLLCQEAYATWAVFLAYGLTKSVEAVLSFYPMFVKQLVFYRDKVDVNETTEQNRFNYDVGAQIVNTLTMAIGVAASQSLLHGRMKLNQGTLLGPDGKSLVLQPPDLTWNDLWDLPHLIETCLAKWLIQICRIPQASFSSLRLIGSCCNFLSAYYVKWKDQTSYSVEVSRKMIETLYNNVICPSLAMVNFQSLLTTLGAHSSLISTFKPGTERDPINVASLGCVTLGGEVVPVIRPSSPFPLLLPLSTLLLSLHSLHPALDHLPTTRFLDCQEISVYITKVCSSHRSLAEHWLTRIETHFISNLLQLAAICGVSKRELYHQTAMCVLTCVHKGDEHLIKELLTRVICDPKFVPDLTGVSGSVGDLSVSDYVPLKSPALAQPILTPTQLTATIVRSLPAIGCELANTLVTKREYEASAVLKHGIPFVVNGITISHTEFPLSLDAHWPLGPIKHAYNSWMDKQESQNEDKSDQSSPEDILTVTRCLQMAYMGLKHRRSSIFRPDSHTSWLQHLSLTFLAANDLFLDPTVSSYLQGCIAEILKFNGYAKVDSRLTIDCFPNFSAWYKRLAEHYMSVSYGDSTFALYLVIPLQQYLPVEFRMTLWGDLSESLQFVFLTPEQVERFVPLRQYLEPAETEKGLIYKYRSSLGTAAISVTKNAFLHSLASHHTRLYLASQN